MLKYYLVIVCFIPQFLFVFLIFLLLIVFVSAKKEIKNDNEDD